MQVNPNPNPSPNPNQLWRGAAGELLAPPPLSGLRVLDLFSERSSQAMVRVRVRFRVRVRGYG